MNNMARVCAKDCKYSMGKRLPGKSTQQVNTMVIMESVTVEQEHGPPCFTHKVCTKTVYSVDILA